MSFVFRAIQGSYFRGQRECGSQDCPSLTSFHHSFVFCLLVLTTSIWISDLIRTREIGMSGETRPGWPVRRFSPNDHSCLPGESGGVSWGAWFACCPQGTYPKGSREDRWCDGGGRDSNSNAPGNSTSDPQCADSKWKLWTLDGRYFCCDGGNQDRGYYYTNSESYYFGCASDDWIANSNASIRRAGSYPDPPGMYY